MRDATNSGKNRPSKISISTHASLAGCDRRKRVVFLLGRHFNSRIPCGMRLSCEFTFKYDFQFQLTHPLRDATGASNKIGVLVIISTHASLAGCDWAFAFFGSIYTDFNSRIPCGMRLARFDRFRRRKRFQLTHPLRDATCLYG